MSFRLSMLLHMRKALRLIYHAFPCERWLKPVAEKINNWFMRGSTGELVIVERNCLRYELDLGQLIDACIYYEGQFEPETSALFHHAVKTGMVVFDIGANVGAHGLSLARLVGEEGHVYMFEPTEWAFNKLKKNLSLNPKLSHVTLEKTALSDQNSSKQQYAIRSQWHADGVASVMEEGVIDYVTLDSYCAVHSIEQLDFIKLDVDGFETKILRGGVKTLVSLRPMLLIEMSDYWQRQAGDSAEAMIEILDSIGYRYLCENTLEPINDILSYLDALEGKATVNVVCVAK
jgi:FkbM family methyltransferase